MTDDLQRECEDLVRSWGFVGLADNQLDTGMVRDLLAFARRQRAAGLREAGEQACEQATRMNDRTLDCACHMDMAEMAAWCAQRAQEVQDGK